MKDMKLQKLFKNFTAVETKVADGQPRTLVVKISDPEPDRSKDTVQPMGMDASNFEKNPVVLFAHNYSDLPIAKCVGLKATADGILATVQFPEEGVYPKADTIYRMYKEGILNAWSIGFMPTDYEENNQGGYNFKTWELFEFSSVPVPDNPRALTIMRSKGIDPTPVLEVKEGNEPKEGDEPAEGEQPKEGDQPKEGEPAEPTEPAAPEPKVADMTVSELKALISPAVEKKDINEVIALSYVLDELHYFIRAFQQNGVSQESIDKLQQALALVMEVTQMQAVLGEKSIQLKDFKVKTGRTISAKHEELLKAACAHMGDGMKAIQTVLETVADDSADSDANVQDGKGLSADATTMLLNLQKGLRAHDKSTGLTLHLIKGLLEASKS